MIAAAFGALPDGAGYVAAGSALAAVNGVTLARFWQDKARAVAGGRRIPEHALLRLAMIGGTPAAYFARRVLRHKTRKQPFSARLHMIAAAQIGAVAAALYALR